MSGGDLPPRQKMIGMMYLVLTALLALNVSKDILDAFVLINSSLENTVVNYNEKNATLYSDFNAAKSYDPVKVTPFWDKAQKAKKASLDLIKYIKNLQVKLVQETEKIPKNVADTLHLKYVGSKDNYDIPTHLLIGETEDASKGLARGLKNKLIAYKKEMLALFSQKEQKALKLDLKTEPVKTDVGMESWEMGNFYHTPLAASITLLSKIQSDIKNVEYGVVSNLLKKAGTKSFNFDTIVTKVIPNANYVMLGEKYQADVFLAAFSTTQNPEILLGKYDSIKNKMVSVTDTIPVKNGLGSYSVPTTKEGIFSYEGVLRLKNATGGVENFPFKSEYIVAKPSLVVSPDKMNVFYIGPENPVSISVPGVASENISATINGSGNRISKISNGKYKVKLSANSPRNVNVTVSATMPDGSKRNMGKMTFVAKKLPKPYARINDVSLNTASKSTRQLRDFRIVKAEYDPNFIFQGLPLTIVKFKMEIYRGTDQIISLKSYSKKLTPDMVDALKKRTKSYDRIYFTDIKVKDVNGRNIILNDVRVNVR